MKPLSIVLGAFVAAAIVTTGTLARADGQDGTPPLAPLPPPSPPSPSATPEQPAPPLSPPQLRKPQRPDPRARPREEEADESNFVAVTVDSDSAGTYLEALTEQDGFVRLRYRWHSELVYGRVATWHRVCLAPCTMRVPPWLRYRISGPSVPASDSFALGGASHSLHVNAGSRGAQAGGTVLLVLGIPTAIVGAVLATAGSSSDGREAGDITLGIGAAMIVTGAVLIALNGTNVYEGSHHVGALSMPVGNSAWLTPSGLVF